MIMNLKNALNEVSPELIQERMDSWDARDWDGIRANYFEYKASLGIQATKTLREFAWSIAAQNCLFALLSEAA